MKPGETSGPLQVFPEGLLGFLQLKNVGRNPQDIDLTLRPVISLWEHYLVSRATLMDQGTRALATGNNGFWTFTTGALVVPNNERWWVESFSVFANLAAGDTVTGLRPALSYTTAGTQRVHLLTDFQPGAVTGGNNSAANTARGFWMPPGSELGFWLQNITAAATVTFTGECRRTILDV